MSDFEKALSSTSGSGGDVIVPQLADQIIPFIRQKSYLRQFLLSFDMPTETYRFPKITAGANVYFVGEAVSAPEPTVSTGQVELVAKKLMAAITMSAELEEDAVLPIVPVIRDDLAKAFAYAEENAFINGDTTHTATALSDAVATEDDWYLYDQRLAFDGLRKFATGTAVDLTGSTFSLADISAAIKNLGKYGRDKSELLLITSLREEDVLRKLLGINLALNQLGLTGTALPGEIGEYFAYSKTRKFGGSPEMDNTEPSLRNKEGVETIHESLDFNQDEDIVRSASIYENAEVSRNALPLRTRGLSLN